MKKVILNLGCGRCYIKNAINVDFLINDCCDLVVNLNEFPWEWREDSVDEIYMLYFLEHFDKDIVIKIFKECHRILKVNGLVHIQVPHYSSMIALTDLGHKTAFGVTSFGVLEGSNYIFPNALFKKETIKINILETLLQENKYLDLDLEKTTIIKSHHSLLRFILSPLKIFFQYFIDLAPIIFERFWCYYIGGAGEIIYRGRKVK
ncbi:MAG: hypothetical protein V1732_01145 [Patescibacteria group bacterium]